MRNSIPAAILAIIALFSPPSFAQNTSNDSATSTISNDFSRPTGVAISQAPEAATGICFGENAAETIACAQADCMKQTGFDAIDCPVTDWCYFAGWTIDVFVQSKDGPHWHEFSCGWPTRKQAELSAKVICQADYIAGCIPVVVWSPSGQRIELN